MFMSQKIRTAKCECGNVTLICTGEPIRTSICHCFECQKRTGSVFGVQARFPAEQVSILGETSQYTRIANSNHKVTYQFCPHCGTTMQLTLSALPESSVIPLGLFKEQDFPEPSFSVYEERKHGWVKFDCQMEHLE
ncbi:GFA family protein [Vibrio sp. 03-59-1]|uniref:GFA family protein n=2 Tax=Vibrio TaxID=662 RepID=UPI0014936DE1|nr:GFA family protein [Vibrio sp. 03-59-1]NOH82265.1 GFA family protein [Vibrio sp. 03-59-1]